jgi:N-formylglutamate amidohydrolase
MEFRGFPHAVVAVIAPVLKRFLGLDKVLICQKPAKIAAPLVLDSPHSGRIYPDDFDHACPRGLLEETEDSYVDELFGDAPRLGVPLLAAQFPRCYIDANRAVDDIDPLLLEAPWPGRINPSTRSDLGMGLIRRLYKSNKPEAIYARFLTPREIEQRIDKYYRPYHKALESLLDEAYQAFGGVWHLNCHSMPTPAPGMSKHTPDVVLGDRDGTSCDPTFTRFVATALKEMGYRVAVNRPYKGVELVRKFSSPAQNRHSLQIELRRSLYMDEQTRVRTQGFTTTRKNMQKLVKQVIDYTSESMADLAAD